MTRASDYDDEIARYELELKRLKTDRRKLQRREENVELRQLKIRADLLSSECRTLKAQRDAMEEWLRQERKLSSGRIVHLWDLFIRSYPQYDYPTIW